MNDMATLLTPDLIRAARALLGLKQTDLAGQAGITQKELSEFETERKRPSAKSSEKLRRVFEAKGLQFIAVNSASSELEGTGVRWRPESKRMEIKIV